MATILQRLDDAQRFLEECAKQNQSEGCRKYDAADLSALCRDAAETIRCLTTMTIEAKRLSEMHR